MLDANEIQELVVIVTKAVEELQLRNFKKFFLKAVRWDEDDEHWCVDFYTEYGNLDDVTVNIESCKSGYIALGVYGSN